MSSKRQRGEGSSSKTSRSYDKKKFISAAAFERYTKLVKKTIIQERGLRPDENKDGEVAVMIAERDWFTFTEQPEPAIIPVVKEFYANAINHDSYTVTVRGKPVSFASVVINRYYQLPPIPRDEYAKYVAAGPNYELIVTKLCQPGTSWAVKEKAAMQFQQSTLSRYGKAWYAFICAKLLPSTHYSDVTKERAVLLYCLALGKTIDVGEIIQRSILRAIEFGTKGGLPHPSLICGLCQQAGVKWGNDEPLSHPMLPLDHSLIMRYKVWGGGESDPRGLGFIIQQAEEEPMATDPTPTAPSTSADTSIGGLSAQLRRLQTRMDRQNQRLAIRQSTMYTYNVQASTALADILAKLNPDVLSEPFPSPAVLPHYPPSDLSDDEDESDEEDDDEETDPDE